MDRKPPKYNRSSNNKLPPGSSNHKETSGNAGDLGSIPGSGKSPREEHGNPLHYSCLKNSMDRGAWQATVCGIIKSRTGPSNYHVKFLSSKKGRIEINVHVQFISLFGEVASGSQRLEVASNHLIQPSHLGICVTEIQTLGKSLQGTMSSPVVNS